MAWCQLPQFEWREQYNCGLRQGNSINLLGVAAVPKVWRWKSITGPGQARVFKGRLVLSGVSSSAATRQIRRSTLAVLDFLVPGHLDGLELGFVGNGWTIKAVTGQLAVSCRVNGLDALIPIGPTSCRSRGYTETGKGRSAECLCLCRQRELRRDLEAQDSDQILLIRRQSDRR